MAEEPEKIEEGQQAEDQTEGQQTEGQAEGEAEDTEPKTVPYERFQEVVDKVKQLEEQAEVSAQQRALAKANPAQGPKAPAQGFDIFKEAGLDPEDAEDIPNQGQLKKIMTHYGTVFDARLAEIAFQQAHPDYADIVGTADEIASGKYAEPLAAAIKDNPALIRMIAQSGNPRLAAYEVAKLQKSKTTKTVKTDEAKTAIDEAVENAKRVKSSSNAKGGGALSEEGRYESMSDEDFLKLAHTHGAIV